MAAISQLPLAMYSDITQGRQTPPWLAPSTTEARDTKLHNMRFSFLQVKMMLAEERGRRREKPCLSLAALRGRTIPSSYRVCQPTDGKHNQRRQRIPVRRVTNNVTYRQEPARDLARRTTTGHIRLLGLRLRHLLEYYQSLLPL